MRRDRRKEAGTSLIGALVSGSIVVLSLGAYGGSILQLKGSRQAAEEEEEARAVLIEAIAGLRSKPIGETYKEYRPDPYGKPFPAEGGGMGAPFKAPHLHSGSGEASVKVEFYTDEAANLPELGFPRDLDGDGQKTQKVVDEEHGVSSPFLPTKLTLEFESSRGGTRQIEWTTVLMGSTNQ